MAAGILADLVLALHLAFIGFVVLGALAWLRFGWAPWIHLPALGWGVFVELSGRICPLTPLENALRRAAGEQGYGGSFIDHYITPIVYPAGLTPTRQIALGIAAVLLNALLYSVCWRRRRLRSGLS